MDDSIQKALSDQAKRRTTSAFSIGVNKLCRDRNALLKVCKWLEETMDKDSRIWCAIREHPEGNEWIDKFRAAIQAAEGD